MSVFYLLQHLKHFIGWESSSIASPSPYAEPKGVARCSLESFDPPPLNTNLTLPILPPEIVELIVRHAAQPLQPPSHASYKEQLLIKMWFSVVVLHEPSDWDRVMSPDWMGGLGPVVRVVLAAKGALTSSLRNRTNTEVLMNFNGLSRVSLDYHNDFLRSGSNYPYYQLITELPRSLKVLEILNAHGPDEHIIKLASRCCPDLTELRLGRCTMFNNQNYRGVEAYAAAVGNLIENMPKLRVLHIGVYLTPIEAVWAHRVDHRSLHPITDVMRHENPEGIHNHLHQVALAAANGEDPEPPVNYHYPPLAKQEIWDAPCSECDKYFKVPAENAEMRTACVYLPGSGHCEPSHLRPSRLLGDADGKLLDEEDASEMLPQLGQENPPIRQIKVDAGRIQGGDFFKRKSLTFEISSIGNSIVISPPINEPNMPTVSFAMG
ncbi:hypothetical protein RhiXN_04530 [Rhizoctonia solani]|uniref:F-box domain-containing protein n=1 Tax=Rhizoctonia solani TaxID=456999 RepID=A0A8H8SSZ2_9AGAM|nr:uncharacterized protein RhiXN_04530 [Rhizoctonia solani]QRW16529.1 hypothetical protein RhiXN_04530 [Rhizoctonia solani]